MKKSENIVIFINKNLERGKKIYSEWNEENKLKSIINECIIIENNIMNINKVNNDIEKYNSINKNIKFVPYLNKHTGFIENIKFFGNLIEVENKEKKFKIVPIVPHSSQQPTIVFEEIDGGKLGGYF